MKIKSITRFLLCLLVLSLCFTTTVLANSSWHWISETRPFDLLPIVAIITIVIEILAIKYIALIHNLKRVSVVVVLSNILSFIMPYMINNFIRISEKIYSFSQMIESTPIYTVGIIYLIMTLAVELPCVYFVFKNETENKRRLFITVVFSNVITTFITLAIERIVCNGVW